MGQKNRTDQTFQKVVTTLLIFFFMSNHFVKYSSATIHKHGTEILKHM